MVVTKPEPGESGETWIEGRRIIWYRQSWFDRHEGALREWQKHFGHHYQTINWEGVHPCGRPLHAADPNPPRVAVMKARDYYQLRANFE